MTHNIVVFLGPTLRVAEAREYLNAVYLPPAQQGSVFQAAVDHRPAIIAIIDGVFAQRPAVRHKEILWAMAEGIEVHGSSSMGALRAAELARYGMVGHGFIHRWYRRTPLADDADVAVAIAPRELRSAPLGEALINMRLTLRHAVLRGIIGRGARATLERIARSQYFVDRQYPAMLRAARLAMNSPAELAELEALEKWLPTHAIDRKRSDAIGLLRHLARQCRPSHSRRHSPFELTEAWATDLKVASQWDDFLKYRR